MRNLFIIGFCFIVIGGTAYTYFHNPEKFPVHTKVTRISGIVVPHHDLVKKQRQALFVEMAERFSIMGKPKTVILISPNHFNAGRANVQTNSQIWDTFDGEILPQTDVIDALIASKAANNEPKSFNNEH